jgi:hypothetical protein
VLSVLATITGGLPPHIVKVVGQLVCEPDILDKASRPHSHPHIVDNAAVSFPPTMNAELGFSRATAIRQRSKVHDFNLKVILPFFRHFGELEFTRNIPPHGSQHFVVYSHSSPIGDRFKAHKHTST